MIIKYLIQYANSKLFKGICIFALLFIVVSTAFAESIPSFYVTSGMDSFLRTWKVTNTYGSFGDSFSHGGDDTFYYQTLHGRGWSFAGGPHIVSETSISGYNLANLDMPESGPLIGTYGYVATKHIIRAAVPVPIVFGYTSHDGYHSTSSCFHNGC